MFNGAFYVGEDERRCDVHCEIFSWPDPVLSATCVNTAWIFANCGHMLVSARRLISHLFAFIIDICWNQHDEPIIIIKWRLMFFFSWFTRESLKKHNSPIIRWSFQPKLFISICSSNVLSSFCVFKCIW